MIYQNSDHEKKLYDEVNSRKIDIDILINNAWFWLYWNFSDTYLYENLEMINLNIYTLTELTGLFLDWMLKKKSWKILNVASTAAFQPIPRFSVYSATKSFVLSFTEALHYELKNTWVSVTTLCPWPTATSFEHTAKVWKSKLFSWKLMTPNEVANTWYKALMRNEMTIVPWFKNKFLAFMSSISPSRKMILWISDKIS